MNRQEPQWGEEWLVVGEERGQRWLRWYQHPFPNLPSTHRRRWHHQLSSTSQTLEWHCWYCWIVWFWSSSRHRGCAIGMSRSFRPLHQSKWPIWCWCPHQMHHLETSAHNRRWQFPCLLLKSSDLHCRAQSQKCGLPNLCSRQLSPTSKMNRQEPLPPASQNHAVPASNSWRWLYRRYFKNLQKFSSQPKNIQRLKHSS